MMESLIKKNFGLTKEKATGVITLDPYKEKRSANCNICGNFANIFDKSHRLSTTHQNKLTDKFRLIRSKMKIIKLNSFSVHDIQWEKRKEKIWCYFCDKSVDKHGLYEGCCIETFGFLTHLTDSKHMEAVKSYLKYHSRKENFEIFCKNKVDLEKFLTNIPEVKNKYLAKLNFLHIKDVAKIKEVEAERQLLINRAFEVSSTHTSMAHKAVALVKEVSFMPETSTRPQHILLKRNNLNEKTKICPWIKPSEKEFNHQVPERPVIGPTMDTLKKHVADQKKKMLPVKRLGANFQRKQIYSSHWLPSFSGVWNKGRHRQLKLKDKHSR